MFMDMECMTINEICKFCLKMLFHFKNWQMFQVQASSSLMNFITNSQAKF